METEKITEDTLEKYEDLLPGDTAENIGRTFFRALALKDEPNPEEGAALVWELKNVEEEGRDTEAELIFFHAAGEDSARELLDGFLQEAASDGVSRSYFEWARPEESVRESLADNGFEITEKEGRDLCVSLAELSRQKIAQKEPPSYIVNIGELKVKDFRRGITDCLLYGHKGLLEDLAYLPMNWFERDISCAVVTDGNVNGLFLIRKTGEGTLMPVLLFAEEPDSRVNLLHMLRFAIRKAAAKYRPDTKVILRRNDESVRALAAYFFPEKKGQTVTAGEK